LALNQDNVSKWGDISISRLLFQWSITIKIQLSVYWLSVIFWNGFSPFHIIIIATCMICLFSFHNFQLVEGVKHLVEVLFLTNEGTRVWVSESRLS
jgi:hypothetical protein